MITDEQIEERAEAIIETAVNQLILKKSKKMTKKILAFIDAERPRTLREAKAQLEQEALDFKARGQYRVDKTKFLDVSRKIDDEVMVDLGEDLNVIINKAINEGTSGVEIKWSNILNSETNPNRTHGRFTVVSKRQ